MADNIFSQALEILDTNPGDELTQEEQVLMSTATIPLLILARYNDIPIGEGLEELADILEEAKVK